MEKLYPCPCCGFLTLTEEPPGTYDICEICFWEDDYVQYFDPDSENGANHVSLRQGQKNYLQFGSCEERCTEFVRKPNKNDVFVGPKDVSKIQRMPITELINIFNAINVPLENVLDIYKGFIKISNCNYVFNSAQLLEYITVDESSEYSMLKNRDNPNIRYGNAKLYEMTEDEVNNRINEIQEKFIECVRIKHKLSQF